MSEHAISLSPRDRTEPEQGEPVNAALDAPDEGDVLSIARRYQSTLGRLQWMDDKWIGMADHAHCYLKKDSKLSSKLDVAAAAHALLLESERLFLAVFRRRTETVTDIAVVAFHVFVLLDREVRDNPHPPPDDPIALARKALADIAVTAAKASGLDFSTIGAPDLSARVRACLGR